MKTIAFAFISIAFWTGSFAQTLFTYGNKAVTKTEFLNAFNKNPGIDPDRKKALKEYLNLYINFKLKVQAAYDAGLDKDGTQNFELQNFRHQIADNIINEQANLKDLVQEAFERSRKEIHLAQVFIEVPANTDTSDAYKKIMMAWKDLKDGKDFNTITNQYSSDDAVKQSNGDLGFITAFSLPYRMENVAYSLKPNTFSAPIKSKVGYHIFKNLGERTSLGSRRVAQILVALPPTATTEDKEAGKKKADSIYNLLANGSSFEELTSLSNDLSSTANKGELPEFTIGTYDSNFEQVAFSLKKPGDISKPFATSFGYHIVKLLEAKPAADNIKDVVTFGNFQDKVIKDNRLDAAKKAFIEKKLPLLQYKKGIYKEHDLFAFTDSAIKKQGSVAVRGINNNTVLFSFAKQKVKAADWISYVRVAESAEPNIKSRYPALMQEFIRVQADQYYRNHMEDYDPNFTKQVQEFKEANLLFGIMEKNIWSKANADTIGLQQYYNEHKTKYTWAPSADAILITCSNQGMADSIEQQIKSNPTGWREVTSNYGNAVVADSGRYELSQLPVVDRTNFSSGLFTAPVKNENDGTYSFNYVVNVYKEQAPRSFDDSRGIIITDYQQVLEDKWIAELKKKYNVKVDEAVFNTIK